LRRELPLLLCYLLTVQPLWMHAQEGISVLEEQWSTAKGEPIIGATVAVKGNTSIRVRCPISTVISALTVPSEKSVLTDYIRGNEDT
jgi:hypothetical protein